MTGAMARYVAWRTRWAWSDLFVPVMVAVVVLVPVAAMFGAVDLDDTKSQALSVPSGTVFAAPPPVTQPPVSAGGGAAQVSAASRAVEPATHADTSAPFSTSGNVVKALLISLAIALVARWAWGNT